MQIRRSVYAQGYSVPGSRSAGIDYGLMTKTGYVGFSIPIILRFAKFWIPDQEKQYRHAARNWGLFPRSCVGDGQRNKNCGDFIQKRPRRKYAAPFPALSGGKFRPRPVTIVTGARKNLTKSPESSHSISVGAAATK